MSEIEQLRDCSLFAGLTDEQLHTLAGRGRVIDVARDEMIFEQDTPESEVYVLLAGRVQIEVALSRKTEQAPLHTAVPGEVFGEFAIVADIPRSASAVAMQDSQLFVFSREVFEALCEADTRLGYVVMRNLARILVDHIRKTTSELRASLMF